MGSNLMIQDPPPGFRIVGQSQSQGAPPPPPGFSVVPVDQPRPAVAQQVPVRNQRRPRAVPQPNRVMADAADERMFANAGGGYERDGTATVSPIPAGEEAPVGYDYPGEDVYQGTGETMAANLEHNINALGGYAGNLLTGQGLDNEVVIENAVKDVDGQAFAVGSSFSQPVPLGYSVDEWETLPNDQRRSVYDNALRLAEQGTPEQAARLTEDFNRSYQATENIPPAIRSLLAGQTGGGTGIVPYVTGAAGLLEGLDFNAARSGTRAAMQDQMRADPLGTSLTQLAGGLLTPGLRGSGQYIEGATGAARLGRAGTVGAAYGGASGALNSEGGNVVGDTALGALTGFGTGAVGQGAVDRLLRGTRSTAPSMARRLSREGVDLTPGQMVSEVPVIGPMLRSVEEGASSIPFVGSPIAGARQQSVESFNRAAINRALQPINERLPRDARPGYDSVERAQNIVSDAYTRVLSQTQFAPDQAFYDDLGSAISRTLTDAGVSRAETLSKQIKDRVFRSLSAFDTPITGEQFKALESEFGALAAQNLESTDGATRALGRSYQAVQEALRDGLRRQNPEAAEALRGVNGAYARLMRIESAAGSSAAQATEGVFSPTQLGIAIRQAGSRRASARGDALMQDLAVAGRNIIPSRVGDSGTATRGALTGLAAGAASGIPIAGSLAVPVIGTSVAYSRPAQMFLNAIYRATDSQTAAEGLRLLGVIAQRNPALAPYYQAAAAHVQSLGQTQSPASPPAQLSTRSPMPVQ